MLVCSGATRMNGEVSAVQWKLCEETKVSSLPTSDLRLVYSSLGREKCIFAFWYVWHSCPKGAPLQREHVGFLCMTNWLQWERNMDFWYCISLRGRQLNCPEFTWCGGLPRGQPQHFQAPNPADVQQVAHAPLCGVQQVILESLALSVSLGTTLLSRWFSSYVDKCSVWWKEERFGFKGKPRIQQCCTSKSVRTASWWSW